MGHWTPLMAEAQTCCLICSSSSAEVVEVVHTVPGVCCHANENAFTEDASDHTDSCHHLATVEADTRERNCLHWDCEVMWPVSECGCVCEYVCMCVCVCVWWGRDTSVLSDRPMTQTEKMTELAGEKKERERKREKKKHWVNTHSLDDVMATWRV